MKVGDRVTTPDGDGFVEWIEDENILVDGKVWHKRYVQMAPFLRMIRIVAKSAVRKSRAGAKVLNDEALAGVRQWEWSEESLQELLDQPGDYIEFSYRMRSIE